MALAELLVTPRVEGSLSTGLGISERMVGRYPGQQGIEARSWPMSTRLNSGDDVH